MKCSMAIPPFGIWPNCRHSGTDIGTLPVTCITQVVVRREGRIGLSFVHLNIGTAKSNHPIQDATRILHPRLAVLHVFWRIPASYYVV